MKHKTKILPSGKWHGFYTDESEQVEHLFEIDLKVDWFKFSGKCRADQTTSHIEGSIHDNGKTLWTAHTDLGPSRVYVGNWDIDRGELSGRWRTVNGSTFGRFQMKPGALPPTSGLPSGETIEQLEEANDEWLAKCSVNLEVLRVDSERDVRRALLQDKEFVLALHETQTILRLDVSEKPWFNALALNRVCLTRAVAPQVFTALDNVVDALGLTIRVELYCEYKPSLNANVRLLRADTIAVTLSSEALNVLNVNELCYLLGHEIGHVLLGHFGLHIINSKELSGVVQLRRLALSRYQELSADRVGLLCCQDPAAALLINFMGQSGLTARDRIGNQGAILRAAEHTLEQGRRAIPDESAGDYTHPYGPIRALAIDCYARSTNYHSLSGRKGGEFTDSALEKKVAQLADIMDPAILDDHLGSAQVAEFLALVGLSLADVSSGRSQKECIAIRRIGKLVQKAFIMAQNLEFEEQQIRALELAEQLKVTLSVHKRVRIIEYLSVIAEVDGQVSNSEHSILLGAATLLEAGFDTIDNTMLQLTMGPD